MSYRLIQVNENLQREISTLLQEEPVLEGVFITLTHVITTADLRRATVWLSILDNPEPQKVIDLLNERSNEFYAPLRTRLKMKHIPQLEFKLDDQADELSRIDSIIDTLDGK